MTKFSPGSVARLLEPRGELWSSRQRLEFVVVLRQFDVPFNGEHPELRVAPVSLSPEFATDLDLLCSGDEGGVGVAFMIEVWNQRAMLVEHLHPTVLGTLGDAKLAALYALHNQIVGVDDGVLLDASLIGPPVESPTDPRIAYQEERFALAEPLSHAAEEILFAAQSAATRTPFAVWFPDVYQVKVDALWNTSARDLTASFWPAGSPVDRITCESAAELSYVTQAPIPPSRLLGTGEYAAIPSDALQAA